MERNLRKEEKESLLKQQHAQQVGFSCKHYRNLGTIFLPPKLSLCFPFMDVGVWCFESKWRLAVHAWQLFLEDLADVVASAFQGRREKAVGDAEHLWMQIKILYLRWEMKCVHCSAAFRSLFNYEESAYLFKGLQPGFLPHTSHVL